MLSQGQEGVERRDSEQAVVSDDEAGQVDGSLEGVVYYIYSDVTSVA